MSGPASPFGPAGSAREVWDPAEAAERLAGARKAAEVTTIPRADLETLLDAAGLYVTTFAGRPEQAPGGQAAYEKVREVAARHGRRF